MKVVRIVYCEECGFKKHADILKGCFEEAFKMHLANVKFECKASSVTGTFKVLVSQVSQEKEVPISQEKEPEILIHNKHENTNGFGLFKDVKHVTLLIDLLRKHIG